MTTAEYTEGTARAIVRGDTVVLLPEPVSAELVDRVWAVLPDASAPDGDAGAPSGGVVAVVGVLAHVSGTLTDIPPFAVATWDASRRTARVAVRGTAASVVVTTDDGEAEITGADVLMWAERVVEGATGIHVRSAGAESAAPVWPLLGGVVRASTVRCGEHEHASTTTAAAPAAPDLETPDDPGTWPVPGQRTLVAPSDAPLSQETIVGSVEAPPVPTGASPAEEPVAPAAAPGSTDADPARDAGASVASADAEPGPGDPGVSENTMLGDDGDGYEHLFGDTVFRRVEDAAVRVVEEDDDAPSDAVPPVEPAAVEPVPSAPVSSLTLAPDAPSQPDLAPGDGLIAEVPGAGGPPPSSPLAGTPGAVSRAAAVDSAPQAGPSVDAGQDGLDDHDGHTIMSGELAALREAAGDVPQFSVPAPPGAQDVLALTCPQGHPNPPTRELCRTCRTPLDGDPRLVPRPLLGRILVSSGVATGGTIDVDGGQAVELDRDVVVGRRPRTSTTSADRIPRLVTVTSPQHDISRSHVEVTLEEWHVLVEDLATTNGTMLLRPGQEPRRLHPHQKEIVADGDVVELGDGVTLTFEGIW
ncbi:hypothetical protein GCM10009718_09030 [Isoptericola halotolerans]|uniref:FHA domain-containing protein n=1 Tax=Isoptericola halotolerans TaxID=300560 RepID=A0ABX2A0I7_9MICO|nr:FHA domain-containing protein [Isoptericola halotolerans]NOV96174.1 hypothetical protein [Isoptericola halotolerans]